MPIFAKRGTVRANGETVDLEFNSPLLIGRPLRVVCRRPTKCGSDEIPHGPLDITCLDPQNMAEEQFLAMLRFEERGKLAELLSLQ